MGFSFTPNNMSFGNEPQFLWDISGPSNNSISDEAIAEPIINITAPGQYTVMLTVSNDICPSDTAQRTLFINEMPEVLIDSISNICISDEIIPSAMYLPGIDFIDSISWNFGEGTGYTGDPLNPGTIGYAMSGTYTVSIFVQNGCGIDSSDWSFEVLDGPFANALLDTNFACIPGDAIIGTTNLSSGDNLGFTWSISPSGIISAPDASEPNFTIDQTGWYIITLEANNEACTADSWTDSIFVSTLPSFTLEEVADGCIGTPIQIMADYENESLIDSVRWYFPGASIENTTAFTPPQVDYQNATGVFTAYLETFNACGTILDSVSFQFLEGLNALADLDTNFVCIPPDYTLDITNLTTGGNPSYNWSISPPGIISNSTDSIPVIMLQDTGWYTIMLLASNNGICPESVWQDSIFVETQPILGLPSVDNACDSASLFPQFEYNGNLARIDSMHWFFPGGIPAFSNSLSPGPVEYQGAGMYTYQAIVFNGCGSDTAQQSIVIDTIPQITFSPIDTICKHDGLYTIPEPVPGGGAWSGSEAIVEQNPGIFDPMLLPPGDTLVTIYYNFVQGECVSMLPKEIMVFDLSDVDADSVSTCISVDTLTLINGMPVGGWYVGPGIIDSLNGIFAPSLVGEGTYSIEYFYQLPFTSCTNSSSFTITVHSLPAPDIPQLDSLCVNTPETILNNTAGINTYIWNIENSVYTEEQPTHTFLDTGLILIQLIATSDVGCVDSTTTEVYVDAPPSDAGFEVDNDRLCPSEGASFFPIINEDFRATYTWSFGRSSLDTVLSFIPTNPVVFENNTDSILYYTVSFTVANQCGTFSNDTLITVVNLPWPQMGIDSSQVGCSPYTVLFTNRSTGAPDSCYWTFGLDNIIPGCQDTLSYTFMAFDSTTIYPIGLTVGNECGDSTIIDSITVIPAGVLAYYNLDDPDFIVCPFDTLQFEDASTPIPSVWSWSFGDGTTSTQANPSHVFTTPDTTYDVRLRVSTGCGFDEIIRQLMVLPAPDIDFQLPSFGCVGQEVTGILNLSPTDLGSYLWDFGNGESSMQYTPRPIFNESGQNYPITLTVQDFPNECKNTLTKELDIRDLPSVGFVFIDDDTIGCQVLSGSVESISEFANEFVWSINGRLSARTEIAGYQFGEPGRYPITLIASFDNVCVDSLTKFVEVEDCQAYIPNAFSPNSDGVNDFFTVFGSPSLEVVELLEIYDRWGNRVFRKTDFPANVESEGWDGRLKKEGTLHNTGVYVYHAVVRFTGGVIETYKGDIHLLSGK